MLRLVIFEDRLHEAQQLRDNLKLLLAPLFPNLDIRLVSKNYHKAVDEFLAEGSNQVWLVDLLADRMTYQDVRDVMAQIKWFKSLVCSDDGGNRFLQEVRRLFETCELETSKRDKMYGLGVAIEASRNRIPFLYISQWDKLIEPLVKYLQWPHDPDQYALHLRSISKLALLGARRAQDAGIAELIAFLRDVLAAWQITTVDAANWRLLRSRSTKVVDSLAQDPIVRPVLVDEQGLPRSSAPFNWHHVDGAKDHVPTRDGQPPSIHERRARAIKLLREQAQNGGVLPEPLIEELRELAIGIYDYPWDILVPRLVSADGRRLLEELRYLPPIMETEVVGQVVTWRRPPLRALLQTDSKSDDVVNIVDLWGGEHDHVDTLKHLWLRDVGPASGALRHLWFNLPGLLDVLSGPVGLGKQGGWLYPDIFRRPSVAGLFHADAAPWHGARDPGFLGAVLAYDERSFQDERVRFGEAFPAMLETKSSHVLCRRLMAHGAEWVAYCAPLATGEFGLRVVRHSDVGGLRAFTSNTRLGRERASDFPPLLCFFVRAEKTVCPYCGDWAPLVADPVSSTRRSDAEVEAHVVSRIELVMREFNNRE